MDALLFNLAGDVPVVTKTWTAGIVVMSVLTSTTIVDPNKTLYNFDLAFKRGQYLRVLYSFFDYGELNMLFFFGLLLMLSQLAAVEKTVGSRGQFLWMIFVMAVLVIGMSKWIQPYESLAQVIHKNLLYYKIRRDIETIDAARGGGNVASPLMFRVFCDVMQLKNIHSIWGILMTYLPGHLYYFLEQVVSKIYGVDVCQPPNKWFKFTLRSEANSPESHDADNEHLQE
ncbi:LADA_0D04764g1_1 [Lachancea dasiensis]|uniref:Derlin n=1 Tax=Lachancea dasiensis TaxID=1072105 RepID=A0A1G4J543_9SACH|nr:LADA_0D04764g1_1 [Lachancea dasiensis]